MIKKLNEKSEKVRVTFNLDKSLLEKLEKTVDGSVIRNLSHAAEFYLKKGLGEKKIKEAVILAAGRGTRLYPLTKSIPKQLLPFRNKTIIEYLLEWLKINNVEKVIIIQGRSENKKDDRIKEFLGNGEKYGLDIIYTYAFTGQGTGHALKQAEKLLESDTFLVTNGDELKDISIHKFSEFHYNNNADITIALTTVEDPSAYGVAKMEGFKILEFIEKPKREDAPSNLISSGTYIMNKKTLSLIPEENNFGFMLEKDVFPKVAEKGKLFGYVFSGQWFDTGTFERYEKALEEWKGFKDSYN